MPSALHWGMHDEIVHLASLSGSAWRNGAGSGQGERTRLCCTCTVLLRASSPEASAWRRSLQGNEGSIAGAAPTRQLWEVAVETGNRSPPTAAPPDLGAEGRSPRRDMYLG